MCLCVCVCVCVYVTNRLSTRLLTLYTHFKSSTMPCILYMLQNIFGKFQVFGDVTLCRLVNTVTDISVDLSAFTLGVKDCKNSSRTYRCEKLKSLTIRQSFHYSSYFPLNTFTYSSSKRITVFSHLQGHHLSKTGNAVHCYILRLGSNVSLTNRFL